MQLPYQTELMVGVERTIAFHPRMARVFGGVEAAIYLQQLYFWSNKGSRDDGFIYKTKEEIEEETYLTRYAQDKARQRLEGLGVIETKLLKANGSPTLHYRVNVERANELLWPSVTANPIVDHQPMETLTFDDSISLPSTKPLTENTAETTTESISSLPLADSGPTKKPTKGPTDLHQLVEHVASIQGIDLPLNKGAEYKAAKTILATYSLDMAKATADTMLKDKFWRDNRFTVVNLCSHFPKYKTEPVDPDFDPWEEQNNAVIAKMEQYERDQAYIAELRREIAEAEGGTAHASQDE